MQAIGILKAPENNTPLPNSLREGDLLSLCCRCHLFVVKVAVLLSGWLSNVNFCCQSHDKVKRQWALKYHLLTSFFNHK
jgi:hypothetical protein